MNKNIKIWFFLTVLFAIFTKNAAFLENISLAIAQISLGSTITLPINAAVYGKFKDVTDIINAENGSSFKVSNDTLGGDPAPGFGKILGII